MKRAWQKPKLVIVERGENAEQVLLCCKSGAGDLETSAAPVHLDCVRNMVYCEACYDLECTREATLLILLTAASCRMGQKLLRIRQYTTWYVAFSVQLSKSDS